jgi:uncharacterized protein (DUF1778 family)
MPAKRKEHPLSLRLSEADVAMIDRAALYVAARVRPSCAKLPFVPPRTC